MSDKPSYRLTPSDQEKLRGHDEIEQVEEDQIIYVPTKPEEKEPAVGEKVKEVRQQAKNVRDRIDSLSQRVDKRCGHLKVDSGETLGSPLFQAMVRVFDERTTVVTYDHYKRALKKRQQLAEEDAGTLKEK